MYICGRRCEQVTAVVGAVEHLGPHYS